MQRNLRSLFRAALILSAVSLLNACAYLRIDPYHPYLRSPYINSAEQEKEVLSRARLDYSEDGRIRVLYVQGTPYERGYQQGVLLRKEVQDNLGYLHKQALSVFHFEELLAEVYERMRPYIPQEHIEEMHGLAHGSKLPLQVVHYMHILPSIGEWGGKREFKKILKQMMRGELGTSCSNVGFAGSATVDNRLLAVRILDWGLHRISKLHKYPLITVGIPENGVPYANIGWVGFLGAVSGMNEQGITLGEMGYGDPEGETLFGMPMPFVLRDVMTYARNLSDVRDIISSRPPTASFGFLMTDGKTAEAELYIRDKNRFLTFEPGTDLRDDEEFFPAIKDTVYGGHYENVLADVLNSTHGSVTPELLMEEVIPKLTMASNFQNVVYDPSNLQFWVNNAAGKRISARTQPYTKYDLKKGLKEFRAFLQQNSEE